MRMKIKPKTGDIYHEYLTSHNDHKWSRVEAKAQAINYNWLNDALHLVAKIKISGMNESQSILSALHGINT